MNQFDRVINEVYKTTRRINEAPGDDLNGLPQDGGPTAVPDQEQPAAAPATPAAEPEPVSSEGVANLVGLVQRALAIAPDSMSAVDKAVFVDDVTVQNALKKQEELTRIIDSLNPSVG